MNENAITLTEFVFIFGPRNVHSFMSETTRGERGLIPPLTADVD